MYSGDLKSDHQNRETFEIQTLKIGFQMVWFLEGWPMITLQSPKSRIVYLLIVMSELLLMTSHKTWHTKVYGVIFNKSGPFANRLPYFHLYRI